MREFLAQTKISIVCLLCLFLPVAYADDKTNDAANTETRASDSPQGAASSNTGQPAQLKGSVKSIDVEAAEVLRQMGDSLKRMQRAALELMGEATRQDYIAVGDPDVIGTMIIPAIPSPTGMMAIGPYLPIRENMMDFFLSQIGKLLPIYANYTDSLIMPGDCKKDSEVLLKEMTPYYEDARARYLELLNLSKQVKDGHNQKVSELAVILHDDMEKMNKLRLQVFKLLKDSEKKNKTS